MAVIGRSERELLPIGQPRCPLNLGVATVPTDVEFNEAHGGPKGEDVEFMADPYMLILDESENGH
jgi:hypothetical protein